MLQFTLLLILSIIVVGIITIFILRVDSLSLIYFSIFISILVILTHKPNIFRLLNRDENKMKINLKKSKNN